MAGFIHISENVGCSLGAQEFRSIVAKAREILSISGDSSVTKLFEYFDLTGDCLLILKDEEPRIFNAFSKAIEAILNESEIEKDRIENSLLEEIFSKLKSDPRHQENSRPP